ncbi:glycosyltransferase [Oceanihabitans sp. 2_MG-2023]|uniref:glycosyltransferase n=1 Tax=Oceanihabitans sp. 2_MG-2023 TaxID=3062661 RepID=UPI0026E30945|nr:glycosyltransferase [Oceanihabitans sp. 2_MG-2023]MDO6597805.1 glycosyltransferase [Oceanihabitans sp. 2_MG-2023]
MVLLNIAYYTFIIVVSIQLIYYLFLFSKFAFLNPKHKTQKNIALSILICAKNEAKNLKNYLPHILNQEYPDFEIILINDNSHDKTLDIMEDFAAKHRNIKIVNVIPTETFYGNKKYALTLGIKAAKNEYLVFTDADCKPNSNHWLKEISTNFSNTKSIVLGYGAYAKIKNSFLNKLIRFETLLTALQYFSYAKSGIPFMGVGRNLAYKKEVFFNANGFINHMQIRSGDDDLFINQVANTKNTSICFTKESFTISNPKTTFKDWILQKRRHVSTANYYKAGHKILLALFYISQFLFYTLAITLFITTYAWQIVLPIFILRLIVFYIVFGKTSKKLEEKDLIIFLPFLEIFLIGMQLVIFIINFIAKPKYWK